MNYKINLDCIDTHVSNNEAILSLPSSISLLISSSARHSFAAQLHFQRNHKDGDGDGQRLVFGLTAASPCVSVETLCLTSFQGDSPFLCLGGEST